MNAEAFALVLAGLVAPWLVKVVNQMGWKGPRALWLALGVSVGLALVALLATGGLQLELAWADPIAFAGALGQAAALVWGLGQVVFQALKDRLELNPP